MNESLQPPHIEKCSECYVRPEIDSSLSDVDNNELALLAQSGDTAAFSELARRFRPRLLAALHRRLVSRADAEDVTQESLTRAWQKIDQFDGIYSFSSWLFTIAFRQATDYLRSKKRREKHARQVAHPTETPAVAERLIVEQELSENLWTTARRELSSTQFTAMWLRYAEDLSVREIARVLGRTRVGIRVLLHRSREIMQRYLSDDSVDGGSK